MRTPYFLPILVVFLAACVSGRAYSSASEESLITPGRGANTNTQPIFHPVSTSPDNYDRNLINPDTIAAKSFLAYHPHEGEITALAVSRDGRSAFTGGQDGTVVHSTIVENRGESRMVHELLLKSTRPILAVELSPDEQFLAISQYSSILLLDLETGQLAKRMTQIKGQIRALAWDPRASLLAFGRADGDIFIWNLTQGPRAGEDNLESIETYPGSLSHIAHIIFHPAGRAFFSIESEGGLSVWRVLRTERQMGLRDESALHDRRKVGKLREEIAGLRVRIEDAWLDEEGAELFVSTAGGYVYRWKIRGLRFMGRFPVGNDVVFSVRGVELSLPEDQGGLKLLVTSSRDQRLRFWCRHQDEPPAKLPGVGVMLERTTELGSVVVPAASAYKLAAATQGNGVDLPGGSKKADMFVAETVRLEHPISIVRVGKDSTLLWAAQKTGSLLFFDVSTLLGNSGALDRVRSCKE